MIVQILYTSCMYKMYTKYVSCIQNVQKYVQNTYRLDVMVAGFLLAKPPPSTTQNGMFLSYNHYKTRICHVRFTNIVYKMYTINKFVYTKHVQNVDTLLTILHILYVFCIHYVYKGFIYYIHIIMRLTSFVRPLFNSRLCIPSEYADLSSSELLDSSSVSDGEPIP
jgi:hypothetical protein